MSRRRWACPEREEERIFASLASRVTNRDILLAETIEWWDETDMGLMFTFCPWEWPHRFSHSKVRYWAEDGSPSHLSESWSPVALMPLEVLTEWNDEDDLNWLQERWPQARLYEIDENVTIRVLDERTRALLQISHGEPSLILWRMYFTKELHPLLAQQLTFRRDHLLLFRRIIEHEREGGKEGPVL